MRRFIVLSAVLLTMSATYTVSAQAIKPVNELPISVDLFAPGGNAINIPTVKITLCVPGSTRPEDCETIDHILVDTGATGLRIEAGAIMNATLLAALTPEQVTTRGTTYNVGECLNYVTSSVWGSVTKADVWLGTETNEGLAEKLSNLPLELISGTGVPVSPPSSCGAHNLNTVAEFSGNGTIGVAMTPMDDEYHYFLCIGKKCTRSGSSFGMNVPLNLQVPNPIDRLRDDNNGVVIQLDALGGMHAAATAAGKLILGIGTRDNNVLATDTQIFYANNTIAYPGQPQIGWLNSITITNGVNQIGPLDQYTAIDSGTNTLSFGSLLDGLNNHEQDASKDLETVLNDLVRVNDFLPNPSAGKTAHLDFSFDDGPRATLTVACNALVEDNKTLASATGQAKIDAANKVVIDTGNLATIVAPKSSFIDAQRQLLSVDIKTIYDHMVSGDKTMNLADDVRTLYVDYYPHLTSEQMSVAQKYFIDSDSEIVSSYAAFVACQKGLFSNATNFCPSSPITAMMTLKDTSNPSVNADYLLTIASATPKTPGMSQYAAFDALATTDKSNDGSSLIGLPFFYGKTLYFAINGKSVINPNSPDPAKEQFTGPFYGLPGLKIPGVPE